MRAQASARKKASFEDVPTLIKRIRSCRKLTQEALAREMSVTFSTVNGWENGRHRPIPSLIGKLIDIAGAAGLTIDGADTVVHNRARRLSRLRR